MPEGAAQATVLVVDDTDALRATVARKLRESGQYAEVWEAVNGLEALHAAGDLNPDLILLDLSMPVMDGVTALPQLRQMLPCTHIVIFSGFEHAELRPRLSAAGASAFIEKGTPLRKVLAALEDVLQGPVSGP